MNFSGNQFVDAGLAGMCAAAEVTNLAALDEAAIVRATERLLALITSDAAFKPRIIEGEKKPKSFAGNDITVIQTKNGVLSQSSCKAAEIADVRKKFGNISLEQAKNKIQKQNYEARVRGKLAALLKAMKNPASQEGQKCFVDGNPACFTVGNDEFPLVDSRSKRNFHPALGGGHPVGALTALAVEFFPLSVLRTGPNSGFFWFVHTAQEEVAIAVAKKTVDFMTTALIKGDFGFFGDWNINNRGKETALVALVRELTGSGSPLDKAKIEKLEFPVAAYIFSNDSRSPSVEVHDLPHPLWKFFLQLQGDNASTQRFNREVLGAEKKGWLLAREMLNGRPIVGKCLVRVKDSDFVMLRGGWTAQAHYAHEVLNMKNSFLQDIEALSQRVLEHPKAKDFRFDLERAKGVGEVGRTLLRLVRNQILDQTTFGRLNPPETPTQILQTRDFLLAALYERLHCAAANREFLLWKPRKEAQDAKISPIVVLAEEIGAAILRDDRHNRLVNRLSKVEKVRDLRGEMLKVAAQGNLNWAQWIAFFPPDKPWTSLLLRDYLLAYLYTHMERAEVEKLPEPTAIAINDQELANGIPVDDSATFLALVA